jgi:hypothetical protein
MAAVKHGGKEGGQDAVGHVRSGDGYLDVDVAEGGERLLVWAAEPSTSVAWVRVARICRPDHGQSRRGPPEAYGHKSSTGATGTPGIAGFAGP